MRSPSGAIAELKYAGTWALILIVQMAAVVGWWWFMPQGFPVWHNRFWVNSALPWLGLFVLITAIRGLARPSRFRDAILMLTPGFWAGAAITAVVLFPNSSLRLLPLIPMAVSLSLLAWSSLPRTRAQALSYLAGASVGVFVLFAQRAPSASTCPSGTQFESPPAELAATSVYRQGPVLFDPAGAVISFTLRGANIQVQPLLGFHSRSPDRCWTLFARARDREGPERRLLGAETKGSERIAYYESDVSSRLAVNVESPHRVSVDSTTRLTAPIYSHLNNYCSLTVAAGRPVSVIFSPCPDTPIAVDVPRRATGTPIRIAFFDEDGFHVVEAARSNKGPFTEIAAGPLQRGEPLSLTFVAGDAPLFRIELKDWSRQASTELSPTAGWGVPMNAIELWPTSGGCLVGITLAETSVGTGFDSVGHAAGVYRGRMVLELLE